jgi:hypothetical protein
MNRLQTSHINGTFVNLAPYAAPGSLADLVSRVDECFEWLEDTLQQPLRGRVNNYKKLLGQYERIRGVWSDKMHDLLQSVSELTTLVEIAHLLREQSSEEFKRTLKLAVDGKIFLSNTADRSSDRSRNFLFELATACQFARAGFPVNLSKRTDVVVETPKLHIECKRASSEGAIRALVKDALAQIRKTCEPGEGGVVYLDITEMAEIKHIPLVFNHTGFLERFSRPPSKEALLAQVADYIDEHVAAFAGEKARLVSSMLPDHICLVQNYSFAGFQLSLMDERAVIGRRAYVYAAAGATSGAQAGMLSAIEEAGTGVFGLGQRIVPTARAARPCNPE